MNESLDLISLSSSSNSQDEEVSIAIVTRFNDIKLDENVSTDDHLTKIKFNDSPFYKQLSVIQDSILLINPCGGKLIDSVKFTIGNSELELLKNDESHRLCLYCGELDSNDPQVDQSIELKFPTPLKLTVNNNLITENLVGLKKRKGTIHPVDITQSIQNGYSKDITVSFDHGKVIKKYVTYCSIVKVYSVNQLLSKILEENELLPLSSSVAKLKDGNVDIISSSFVISLLCPISFSKLKYPVVSKYCNHIECFDVFWFLTSQQQIPTWECPICKVKCTIEDLVISEFLIELLEDSEESTEKIAVSSDGSWEELLAESQSDDSFSDGDNSIIIVNAIDSKQSKNREQISDDNSQLVVISAPDNGSENISMVEEIQQVDDDSYDMDNSIFLSLDDDATRDSVVLNPIIKSTKIVSSEPLINNSHQKLKKIRNILGTPPLKNETQFSNFEEINNDSLIQTSESFGSFEFSTESFTNEDDHAIEKVVNTADNVQDTIITKRTPQLGLRLQRDRGSVSLNAYIQE
ncbi:hypothetical protein TPHA_0J02980 [Tetrapisispora phaffii CBS 4417]|uniref:SP-RING-type domain-containing protein n=1 Tax=Tetrapisispora phaffii (strain ATCC 24235 / CBS 4417 / NBRC 1672 / NRRL Y-8282 / UCD 70-5) TaxID=1071381 RepID=G8BY67_TETPH|nr:hypothetical protein TPHA_0J02980 [Tetrapisispora phaffii CBS 4417]CCE65118.1 hypothetical protein TPHA_0J02980 [Tetrapisispora phaffii CBS 4417]